jgi:predicted dienelactone hydrolase
MIIQTFRRGAVPALAALLIATAVEAAEPVGFRTLQAPDAVGGEPIGMTLWYPSADPQGRAERGPFILPATRDAAPRPGRYRLVAISHGTGGNWAGHRGLAIHLGQRGIVVATFDHPKDRFGDTSGFGTDIQLVGRSRHLARVIDAALGHAAIGPLIDRERIGAVGYSAGGYTVLTAAGGVPQLKRRPGFCDAMGAAAPRLECGLHRNVRILHPDWRITHDPRIKAAVAMAPALGFLFERDDLKAVRVPLRIYRAEHDEVVRHPFSEEIIVNALPTRPEYVVIPGARHFVFLTPCDQFVRPGVLPRELCEDPPGIDRAAIHRRLNDEIVEFFDRTLGKD